VGAGERSSTLFYTSYINKSSIIEKEMDKKEQLISAIKEYFNGKAKTYSVDIAFLYGSWAIGCPKASSDVDVAIIFNKEMDRDKIFDLITTISLELTNILKRETNVLHIDTGFYRPMLYYNAIVQGIPVFVKNFTRYVDARHHAIYQMEDFSIFGTKWQSEIVERRLEKLNHA